MTTLGEKILIVEDDDQISNFMTYILENEGYQCETAKSGKMALTILVSNNIDLMLLDLGLPDIDGTEIITKIREWTEMPVIVVSARDQEHEKAKVLDLGADDYLTKPFSSTELLARIRVAFRHFYKTNQNQVKTYFKADKLTLDIQKRVVTLDDEPLHVTPMEYQLLTLLFKNQGKVLTTSSIIKELWGVAYGNDTQALRALMAGLRRKIEKTPANPHYIITEIGVGYRMIDE